jgi:hypothetical protein
MIAAAPVAVAGSGAAVREAATPVAVAGWSVGVGVAISAAATPVAVAGSSQVTGWATSEATTPVAVARWSLTLRSSSVEAACGVSETDALSGSLVIAFPLLRGLMALFARYYQLAGKADPVSIFDGRRRPPGYPKRVICVRVI